MRQALCLMLVLAACDRGTIEADAEAGQDVVASPDTGAADTAATEDAPAEDDAGADGATSSPDAAPDTGTDAGSPDVGTGSPDAGSGCPEPTGERPQAMGELDGVVDEARGRLVMFGGDVGFPVQCQSKPDYNDQTWELDLQCMQWHRLNTLDEPEPRGRHLAVLDEEKGRMLIFGGRWRKKDTSGDYTLFQDVWAFDLAAHTWTDVTPKTAGPKARWGTAGAFDAKRRRLIVFAGNTGPSGAIYQPTSDTWALDVDKGTWSKVDGAGPPARLFADAVIDADGDRMIVFGGTADFFGPFLNDTWALDLATDTWTELHGGGKSAPEPRIRPELVIDAERGRLVLFAGHDDGAVGNRNDVWTFNLQSAIWTRRSAGDEQDPTAPAAAFCEFPPNFVVTDLDAPERREAHSMLGWAGGDAAVVFGGKTDCGIIDDLWTLSLADLSWTEQIEATVGESCIRAGGEGCHDLCF